MFSLPTISSFLLAIASIGRSAPAPAYDGKYYPSPYAFNFSGTPYAKTDGRLFNINGKTQYLTGANAWWVPRLSATADVDKILEEFQTSGLKVLRSWAYATVNFTEYIPFPGKAIYGSWFQLINQTGTYVNYGPRGLQQLDYLVHAAEEKNIFLVLPLVDYNGASPTLSDDLGGIDLYQNVFGCSQTQWYTDSKCQGAYRSYVETIVTRYQTSPAIFAWEIMNEPRCHLANTDGCDPDIIYNWASNTSAWIKSLDPNHMVTLGEEGFFYPQDDFPTPPDDYVYSGADGVDFVKNIAIPTLDYDTVHCYPSDYNFSNAWANTWIKQHDQVGQKVGKPVVIEEYGSDPQSNVLPWQKTILKSTNIALDLIWDFDTNVSQVGPCKGCPVYSDDLSLFYGTPNFNKYVVAHSKAMAKKKVK